MCGCIPPLPHSFSGDGAWLSIGLRFHSSICFPSVDYLTTLQAARLYSVVKIYKKLMNNWRGFKRKWSGLLEVLSWHFLEGTEGNHKNLQLWHPMFWTEHLLKTCLGCYCYANSLGVPVFSKALLQYSHTATRGAATIHTGKSTVYISYPWVALTRFMVEKRKQHSTTSTYRWYRMGQRDMDSHLLTLLHERGESWAQMLHDEAWIVPREIMCCFQSYIMKNKWADYAV
jgi:hypothetical protein